MNFFTHFGVKNLIAELEFNTYMRFDGGYGFTNGLNYDYQNGESNPTALWNQKWGDALKNAKAVSYKPNKQAKGFFAGIGVGSTFSRFIRGDVVISYAQLKNKPKKSGSGDNIIYPELFFQQTTDIRGMGNIYFQLPVTVDFLPFIGGGIGISGSNHSVKFVSTGTTRVKTSNENGSYVAPYPTKTFYAAYNQLSNDTLDPKTNDAGAAVDTIKGAKVFNMVYQGSVGISYQISDGMYIDIAYRVENNKKYINDKFPNPGFMTQSVIVTSPGNIDQSTPEYQSYTNFSLTKYTKNIILLSFRSDF